MRLVGGADQRNPVVPTSVALAGLALLSGAVVSGIAVAPVALLLAIAVMLVIGYPYSQVLQWRMLLAAIIGIILFVPIRRYMLPGHLPFNFELYRIVVALVLAGWLVALLVDRRVRLAHSVFDRLIALLVGGVLLSDVLNPGRVNSVGPNVPKALSFFLSYVLVYYLIVSVVRDWGTIDFLLKVLVGGGTVVGAFALIERRTDYNVFNHLHTVAPFLHVEAPGTLGSLRAAFFPKGGLIAQQSNVVAGNELRSNGRLADIGPSLHELAPNPIFGEGYGTRIVGFDEKYNNAAILDDQWLGTLLETGIVGFFAWLWIFCRCVRRLSREAREDDSERGWLYTGLAASIAAFGVGMTTFDAFSFTQAAFVFFILFALAGVVLSRGELREAVTRSSA